MSLDLDADILITQEAPITALIQRMGRCNRKTELPLLRLGEIYVYKPEDDRPYEKEDLLPVCRFPEELTSSKQSVNRLLKSLWRNMAKSRRPETASCDLREAAPTLMADAEDFRDLDERTTPGILDLDVYLRADKNKRPGLIVPVPLKLKSLRCTHRDAKHLVLRLPLTTTHSLAYAISRSTEAEYESWQKRRWKRSRK